MCGDDGSCAGGVAVGAWAVAGWGVRVVAVALALAVPVAEAAMAVANAAAHSLSRGRVVRATTFGTCGAGESCRSCTGSRPRATLRAYGTAVQLFGSFASAPLRNTPTRAGRSTPHARLSVRLAAPPRAVPAKFFHCCRALAPRGASAACRQRRLTNSAPSHQLPTSRSRWRPGVAAGGALAECSHPSKSFPSAAGGSD